MQWLRDPQRHSRDDIRASRQALLDRGYSQVDAHAELAVYLRRVRAALTAPCDAALAGFLTGAALAFTLLVVLILALESLVRVLRAGWTIGWLNSLWAAYAAAPLVVLPTAILAAPMLGLVGAGLALIIRMRWRRAGALRRFTGPGSWPIHLPDNFSLWLGMAGLIMLVAGLIVLIIWALAAVSYALEAAPFGGTTAPTTWFWWMVLEPSLAGPALGSATARGVAFMGVFLGATAFGVWFQILYAKVLARASPVNAAARARFVLEREAALRRRRTDKVFGAVRAGSVTGTRNPDELAHRIARLSAARGYGRPLWRRLGRYGLLTGGVTFVVWLVAQQFLWNHQDVLWGNRGRYYMTPDLPGPEAWVGFGVVPLGLLVGLGLAWVYARYFEDL